MDYCHTCQENNIGVITYSSLQQGLLAGVPYKLDSLLPQDERRRGPHFKEPEWVLTCSQDTTWRRSRKSPGTLPTNVDCLESETSGGYFGNYRTKESVPD